MERHGRTITSLLCFHIVVLHLLFLVGETVARVPSVIVFGDSSVDAGNNNFIPTIARSNFQPYGRDFEGGKATGRFCNGKIPTDFISESFGLRPYVPAYLDPKYNISDFANGVTFASAATGYDNATSDVLVIHVSFNLYILQMLSLLFNRLFSFSFFIDRFGFLKFSMMILELPIFLCIMSVL